jgi:hypothetical protein
MNSLLINWKTTLFGVATAAGGIAALCNAIASGHVDFTVLSTDLALITGGITGIFAKDKNVTGAGDTAKAK